MPQKRSDIEPGTNVLRDAGPSAGLAREVNRFLEETRGPASDRIVQIRVPIPHADPLQWMHQQQTAVRFFWESRDGTDYVAGIGQADAIGHAGGSASGRISDEMALRWARADRSVRYYGGMRFDERAEEDASWRRFGRYRFILPRFELQRRNEECGLACNLVLPRDLNQKDALLREIEALSFPLHTLSGTLPMPLSRNDAPEEDVWHRMVQEALSRSNGRAGLDKVVLARQVIFRFTDSIPRLLLFELLRRATPNCFHFFCQFDEENAFLGASPERLYRRLGRLVESEAVAGTGRRGQADDTDTELAHALLLSDKDQREHAFVRESIRRGFEPLCTSMSIEREASLLDLSMGRHLRSGFQGVLEKDVADVDILMQVSPTAAVGGYPGESALHRIRELEPFDRGWYAGPIGWFSRDAAEFAVAIRSGLVSDRVLTLFSGAGIVEGSDSASEWAEIEQKIGDFIRVLGLDQRNTKY